ncbi:MAG: hypothetical protein V4671_15845 [Armatimonadota bacterium]
MTDARKTSKVSSKAESKKEQKASKQIDLRGESPEDCRARTLDRDLGPYKAKYTLLMGPVRAAKPGDNLLTERFDGTAFVEEFDGMDTELLERAVGVILYVLRDA